MRSLVARRCVSAAAVPLLLLALASPSAAQATATVARVDASDASGLVRFEGFVLAPDGAPARGARVTSSAGGEAVTEENGDFRLEARIPLGAESVQLTVHAAGRDGAASLEVRVAVAGGVVHVGPLRLEPTACTLGWSPTFGPVEGADREILAMIAFDDGTGPALYAGGFLKFVGGVEAHGIARWDGSSWEPLGSGFELRFDFLALAAFDDGSGPALYAGGSFTEAGGVTVNGVAKWDGTRWTALGSGTDGIVMSLAVFDDGHGPALYVGGGFRHAGGQPARGIARWDGTSWSALGAGIAGDVRALAVLDEGQGPSLFAGGSFGAAGGVSTSGIARWDGVGWSGLGGAGVSGKVNALTVFHDGFQGAVLCAGGLFERADGLVVNNLAKWDGSRWSALANGANGEVRCLQDWPSGANPRLIVGGDFLRVGTGSVVGGLEVRHLARWDGAWHSLGGTPMGTDERVRALAVLDGGSSSKLYVGGDFFQAGGASARRIAKSDGLGLAPLSSAPSVDDDVLALTTFDDGAGPRLFAAGAFAHVGTRAGSMAANRIAKWDGTSWAPLGDGTNGFVACLAVHDDGSGPALHAGGSFTRAGGATARRVARWDGSTWSPLGSGFANGSSSTNVDTLVSHDDGGGSALFAAGSFSSAGGQPASGIARWDGASWSAVSSDGIRFVDELASFDDGSGPALYAIGLPDSGFGRVARLEGSTWSVFGGGVDHPARLAVLDDGHGPALYASGALVLANGTRAVVARWDGTSWQPVGGAQIASAGAMTIFDDGSGPALYVGVGEAVLGGVAVRGIAKWNGSSWAALGQGIATVQNLYGLAGLDDGHGPALYAGGSFYSALDSGDGNLAKWGCLLDVSAPVLTCPASVFVTSPVRHGSPPGAIVDFVVTASDDLDPAPSVVCEPPSGSFFPVGKTLVTCIATDASNNRSSCEFSVTVERQTLRR